MHLRLTNRTGLPEPLVRVAEMVINGHPKMDERTFSVTELLKGTKEIVLGRRHHDELEMDVQDTFALWHGTATHELLEKAATSGDVAERRFYLDLGDWDEELRGCKLSGSPDYYDPKTETLIDYKTTKVAAYQQAQALEDKDWLYQTTVYRFLFAYLGWVVKRTRIVAMMKDHSKVKAEVDSSYPQNPIGVVDYSRFIGDEAMEDEVKRFYTAKVKEVLSMRELSDDCIPPCTPKERFEDECWIISKPGAKKAWRRYATKEQAELALETAPEGMEVSHRPGDPRKCRLYCTCAPFCSFYRRYMAEKEGEGEHA